MFWKIKAIANSPTTRTVQIEANASSGVSTGSVVAFVFSSSAPSAVAVFAVRVLNAMRSPGELGASRDRGRTPSAQSVYRVPGVPCPPNPP